MPCDNRSDLIKWQDNLRNCEVQSLSLNILALCSDTNITRYWGQCLVIKPIITSDWIRPPGCSRINLSYSKHPVYKYVETLGTNYYLKEL